MELDGKYARTITPYGERGHSLSEKEGYSSQPIPENDEDNIAYMTFSGEVDLYTQLEYEGIIRGDNMPGPEEDEELVEHITPFGVKELYTRSVYDVVIGGKKIPEPEGFHYDTNDYEEIIEVISSPRVKRVPVGMRNVPVINAPIEEPTKELAIKPVNDIVKKPTNVPLLYVSANSTNGFLFQDKRYDYYAVDGSLCASDKSSQREFYIGNFIIKCSRIKEYIEQCRSNKTYNFQVIVKNDVGLNDFQIFEVNDISENECFANLNWIKTKTYCKARPDESAEAKAALKNFIAIVVSRVETFEKRYSKVGWVNENEAHGYVHSDGVIGADIPNVFGNPKLRVEHDDNIATKKATEVAFGLLTISTLMTTLPLFLFAHASLLASLFKEANYNIRFMLLYVGKSGTFKTTLSCLIANIFNHSTYKPSASFTSTKGGMELGAGIHADSVFIVDDLHPSTSMADQNKQMEKVDSLSRMYGDGVPPHRMNHDYKLSDVNSPDGLCLITGELFDAVSSCIARCLIVNTDDNAHKCDLNLLGQYQRNGIYISTHYYRFIEWIAFNYDSIVNYIRGHYEAERNSFPIQNLHGRYADTYAGMVVVSQIIIEYARNVGFLEDNNIEDEFLNDVKTVILRTIEANVSVIRESDPAVMFLDALQNMLSSGEISIPEKSSKNNTDNQIVGFQDDQYFYLHPGEILRLVCKYYITRQSFFPISSTRALETALDRQNLIVTESEIVNGVQKTKKTIKKMIGGRLRARYLVLIKDVMKSKLEEM